jgi:hypothetical protein
VDLSWNLLPRMLLFVLELIGKEFVEEEQDKFWHVADMIVAKYDHKFQILYFDCFYFHSYFSSVFALPVFLY